MSPVNIIRETTTRIGCGAGGERRRDGVQDCRSAGVVGVCEASITMEQLVADDHLPAGERRDPRVPKGPLGPKVPKVPRPKPPSTARFVVGGPRAGTPASDV